jgi:hypothetical protein
LRQLRRNGEPAEDKAWKKLAREAKNMAARHVPISQTEWSWDCTTPQGALTESYASAGVFVFWPGFSAFRRVLQLDLSVCGGHFAAVLPALAACMTSGKATRPAQI